jgi:hypothetical protein
MKKKLIVLYFINGSVPSPEEQEEGDSMNARFRNAHLVEGNPEECDFVAGAVPKIYEKFPRYGEDEHEEFDHTAGEQIGDCYLHEISRGKWDVYNEDGDKLNDAPITKAEARALAQEQE